MVTENVINISKRLHSIEKDVNVLAGADEVFDDTKNKRQSEINTEVDQALDTLQTQIAEETSNREQSETALETELKEYTDVEQARAEAAEQSLREIYAGLTQTDIEVVASLPNQGVPNKIYRLVGATTFSDYQFNASDLSIPVLLATYDVSMLEAQNGYYECQSARNASDKAITANGFVMPTVGGSLKVKMINKNTANNVRLVINSDTVNAKAIFYNGSAVNATNTWEAGETVNIYYDGIQWQAFNVKGGAGDGVFDISEYNQSGDPLAPTPYANLAAALGTNGSNIPDNYRKRGMSIKFIQQLYTVAKTTSEAQPAEGTPLATDPAIAAGTKYKASDLSAFATLPTTDAVVYYASDGETTPTYTIYTISKNAVAACEYVQNRYMSTDAATNATFTNIANWQGVDDVPTNNSGNLVTSGGVADLTIAFLNDILDLINDDTASTLITAIGTFNGYLNNNGRWVSTGSSSFVTKYYKVEKNDILKIKHGIGNYAKYGFFHTVPSSEVTPDSFVKNEIGNNGYDVIIIPESGYITLSNVNSQGQPIECRNIKSVVTLLTELKLDINSGIYNNLLNIIQPWIPNSSYAVGDIRKYNNTTYICNTAFTEGVEFTEANFTELSIAEAYKILLFSILGKTSITFEDVQYTAFTTGYLDKNGEWKNTSQNFGLGYFAVSKGDVVHIKNAFSNIKNFGIGYFEEIPTIDSEPYYVEKVLPLGWDNNIVVSPIDGYILVPYMTTSGASKAMNLKQIIDSLLSNIPIEPTELVSTISSGYLRGKGSHKGEIAHYEATTFKINCWQLQAGRKYVLVCDLANAYAASVDGAYLVGYGLNSQIPSANGPIDFYYDMYANNKNKITVSVPQATYLIVNNQLIQYFELYEENNGAWIKVWEDIDELKTSVSECMSDYTGKTCIYIGDSISTGNNYQWKGLIEDAYNLKYVRNKSTALHPANGGIKVMPLEDESSVELANKSIWYRCAEQRMNIYDFDIISLFGGTNDMTDDTIVIGTENDIPYVDDASTFTEGSVTDVWSESLTFAQCLIGCIEMLKRDFPTKEIILCTVLPCGGSYGNWTDPVTNLVASEAMANLQVRIAAKYDIKVVPFYWNVRTVANSTNKTFSLDTVHPNFPCALRMRAAFAEILCL